MATATDSVRTYLTDGAVALLLATADGFVIDAAVEPADALDVDSLAAEVAGVFRTANLIGHDVADSAVRNVVITLDNGQAVLAAPIAGEAIGVLVPRRGTAYNDAVRSLEQARETMRRVLELRTGLKLVEAMSGIDEPAADGRPAPTATRPSRIALKWVQADAVGSVVTVRVSLGLGPHDATAKTVGRDTPEQRAILAGEATIRAMLELLPAGYAVELTHLQATSPSREALWALTRFLSPDSEQSLFGIAPVKDGDEAKSAAKAILNAVNRRIEVLLTPPAG
jgi:predicted regulator of Ras-like GTPase activity (Roadblock/LC7/MglB family)